MNVFKKGGKKVGSEEEQKVKTRKLVGMRRSLFACRGKAERPCRSKPASDALIVTPKAINKRKGRYIDTYTRREMLVIQACEDD